MVGHVVGRVVGGAVLAVGVDAEDAEVARVARPHPVVLVPAELAHGRGRGKHQPDIVEVLIDGEPEFIAAIVGIDHARQRGVLLRHFGPDGQHHRVDGIGAVRLVHPGTHGGKHALRHILLPQEEADVERGIGQLLLTRAGHETVLQVVVLQAGVLLHAAEAAMVVGEHQSVLGYHHARAEAAEAHHGVLQRSLAGTVQFAGLQFQPHFLQGAGGRFVQVARHPHAFVGQGGHACQQADGSQQQVF